MMQDKEHCQRVDKALSENGAGGINFGSNSWHFYPHWEHLHGSKTLAKNGWPFVEPGGKRRIVYDPVGLPKSVELLNRVLFYPVSIKMSEEQLGKMTNALEIAAKV